VRGGRGPRAGSAQIHHQRRVDITGRQAILEAVMYMFVSDITGPNDLTDFATRFQLDLLGRLRQARIVAAPWFEDGPGAPPRPVTTLQGWADDNPTATINDAVGSLGWSALTRLFSPAFSGIVPPPITTPLFSCDMPNNFHVISAGTKTCSNNHLFSDNHNIQKCPLDSSALK
jgi:hypothetical protein